MIPHTAQWKMRLAEMGAIVDLLYWRYCFAVIRLIAGQSLSVVRNFVAHATNYVSHHNDPSSSTPGNVTS
jgi:hypothetical protein